MSVQPVVNDALDALEKAGVGSLFEKTAIGWNVKWVDGGTVIHVQGPTITAAIGSHGAQVVHPVKEIPQGIVEVDAPEAVEHVAEVAALDLAGEGDE